jgi:hypothetical protein
MIDWFGYGIRRYWIIFFINQKHLKYVIYQFPLFSVDFVLFIEIVDEDIRDRRQNIKFWC